MLFEVDAIVGGAVTEHDGVHRVESVFVVDVDVGLFHVSAQVLEGHGGGLACGANFGVHRGGAEVWRPAYPQTLDALVQVCGEVGRLGANANGVSIVGAGQGLEQEGRVSDVAGDGAVLPELAPTAGAGGDAGHASLGSLDAEEAAVGGGYADGTAAIAALGEGGKAGYLSGGGAPAGAAGCPGGVPGVAARGPQPVLGGTLVAHLRRVGLAQDDGPGRPDSFRHHVVGVGDVVFEDEGAVGGADALGGVQVLDGYGNAVQRGQTVAPHHGRLGVLRPAQSHVADDGEVGVELRVEAVDAAQVELDKLDGGDLPGGYHYPLLPSWRKGQGYIIHEFSLSQVAMLAM